MGALALGRDRFVATNRGDSGTSDFVNRVTRWIPGDVLALFAAAIAFSEPGPTTGKTPEPSIFLLVLFLVLTPVIVLLGVFADPSGRAFRRGDLYNAVLGTIAFAIWSLAIPFTGWERWSTVTDHRDLVLIIAAAAALVFSLIASGVERRVAAQEALGG